MPNELYRTRLRNAVDSALQQFKEAGGVDHPELQGRIREIALTNLIEPLLFEQLSIGRGKVTDYLGNQSTETDCVIYSRRHLPPIMYENRLGIFPVDAVMLGIEIKSRLTAANLQDSYRKAESLWALKYSTGGYYEFEGQRTITVTPLVPALFAFTSDLTETGKTELERYSEVDPEALSRPTIRMICVPGRGFWWFRTSTGAPTGQWIFHGPTSNYDEVIDFMAVMVAFIVSILGQRPAPNLQPYLMNVNIDEHGIARRSQ